MLFRGHRPELSPGRQLRLRPRKAAVAAEDLRLLAGAELSRHRRRAGTLHRLGDGVHPRRGHPHRRGERALLAAGGPARPLARHGRHLASDASCRHGPGQAPDPHRRGDRRRGSAAHWSRRGRRPGRGAQRARHEDGQDHRAQPRGGRPLRQEGRQPHGRGRPLRRPAL